MAGRVGIIAIVVLVVLAVAAFFYNARTGTDTQARTLNLNEFGVALDLPASLSDVTYTAQTQEGIGTVLFAHALNCTLGAFYKIDKTARGGIVETKTTWTKEKLETAQAPQGDSPAQVKEFTNFYLVFEPSQAACSSDQDRIAAESEKRTALWNALTTAHYMQ